PDLLGTSADLRLLWSLTWPGSSKTIAMGHRYICVWPSPAHTPSPPIPYPYPYLYPYCFLAPVRLGRRAGCNAWRFLLRRHSMTATRRPRRAYAIPANRTF
ncbi:unnamed protein product, partial [Laminaria digitata]